MEENRTPVGRPVFKTGEGRQTSLVGSTPTLFRQLKPPSCILQANVMRLYLKSALNIQFS